MKLLSGEEILERIGSIDVDAVWERVEKLLPPERLVERAEASELIMIALEKFIAQFPGQLCIDVVEDWINAPIGNGHNFRGIVDAAGWHKTDDGMSRIVIDFKTTVGSLDWRWRNRIVMSMQPLLYLSAMDADKAFFVGLALREDFRTSSQIDVLVFEKSDCAHEQVNRYLNQTIAMYTAIANEEVFPQNRPSGCFVWGSKCPFFDDCLGNTMPRKAPEPILYWSPTSLQQFHECPERWRRIKCGEQPEPNMRVIFGSAVHLGIAACLRQIWDLPEPETESHLLASIDQEPS